MIQNAFWILSDGKTVRRISEKKYLKMLHGKRRVGYIVNEALCLVEGSSIFFVPMRQLQQILMLLEKAKP